VRKWYYRIGVVVLLAGAVYVYFNWNSIRPIFGFNTGIQNSGSSAKKKGLSLFSSKDKLNWQSYTNDDGGYRVEVPDSVRADTVPAYNQEGSTEPIHMQIAHIEGNVSYAIAWADNPPITRISRTSPESTLDMARDGAMDRTHTKLITESKLMIQGFPARDFQASTQPGSAFLYARLVYAGQRLYMLTVIYPNAETLHEQDTIRFFNSFKINQNSNASTDSHSSRTESQLPETLPAAQVPAGQGQ